MLQLSVLLNRATRDPLLTTLVVVLVGLVVYGLVTNRLLPRRREGWDYTNEKKKPPKEVMKNIKKLCRSGMYLGDFERNDRYKYLAKYDRDWLWKACGDGGIQYKEDVARSQASGAVKCPAIPTHPNGRPCENIAMRGTLPCQNKNGKCCRVKNGKFDGGCKDPNIAGSRNFNLLRDRAAATANQQPAAAAGGGGGGGGDKVKYISHEPHSAENPGQYYPQEGANRCYYFTASKREDGVWECDKNRTLKPTGAGLIPESEGYPLKYLECAQSDKCVEKIKAHWREWKKNKDTPQAAPQNSSASNAAPVQQDGWKCPKEYPEDQGEKCCKPGKWKCSSDQHDLSNSIFNSNSPNKDQPACLRAGVLQGWAQWDQECEKTGKEWSGAGVTVFKDPNYGGLSWNYGEGEFASLSGHMGGDNEISSIKVSPGFKAILYQRKNFDGSQLEVSQDVPDLKRYTATFDTGFGDWDNTADSMKVFKV